MSAEKYFWLIVLAGFAAMLSFQFSSKSESELIKCGVAGLTASCGSIAQ